MPFFKLDDVDNLEVYKKTRKASLSRISDKPAKFVFCKKHTFKLPQKKVQPIFIFENGRIEADILKAIKANASGPIAEGSCSRNKEGVLVFEVSKGDLDGFDMEPRFQIGAGGGTPPETPPKVEAAKADAPRADVPKAEAPKAEVPK